MVEKALRMSLKRALTISFSAIRPFFHHVEGTFVELQEAHLKGEESDGGGGREA